MRWFNRAKEQLAIGEIGDYMARDSRLLTKLPSYFPPLAENSRQNVGKIDNGAAAANFAKKIASYKFQEASCRYWLKCCKC